MRARIFVMVLGALGTSLHAQPIDLRGRVVQGNGQPVQGAVVVLKNRGISASTAADGSFALNGNSAIGPGIGHPVIHHLEKDILVVDAGFPLEVRMDVCNGYGRSLGAFAKRLEKGRHRLALADARGPGLNPGLYFLRLRLGGEIHVHPFFHPGEGLHGSVFAPAYRTGAAAKRTQAVDSLRIRKTGYQELAMAITSYTAGDLGDLILSATDQDGSICARQRNQRTSDGFDVVFCEALFDQAPRVRLPAATAASAYAAMTSDAFVTESGLSFPHTLGNSADPERIRHASALYDIKIRDGKLESFRPAIVFAESLFMAPLMGKAFDGLISKRTEANRYDLTPSLPVRVHILTGQYQGEPNGASNFQVKAAIANLAGPVTASDGACMPSLSSHGNQAPFAPGAEVFFQVGRVPSMHVFGDDELVFTLYAGGGWSGSLMSTEWFFTPLDLVKNALTPTGTYGGVGHGAPGTIPMLSLQPASGGGEACPQR